MPSPADPVTVRVTRKGADGDGVAEAADEAALYVSFTLPGELVAAVPGPKRGDGRAAVLARIIEASADRVDAPCPHFGFCGGCSL